MAVAAAQLPADPQLLAADLAGISGKRRTKNIVMTALMALAVIVVGFVLHPRARHGRHEGMVDRVGRLPRVVHQGHPAVRRVDRARE